MLFLAHEPAADSSWDPVYQHALNRQIIQNKKPQNSGVYFSCIFWKRIQMELDRYFWQSCDWQLSFVPGHFEHGFRSVNFGQKLLHIQSLSLWSGIKNERSLVLNLTHDQDRICSRTRTPTRDWWSLYLCSCHSPPIWRDLTFCKATSSLIDEYNKTVTRCRLPKCKVAAILVIEKRWPRIRLCNVVRHLSPSRQR